MNVFILLLIYSQTDKFQCDDQKKTIIPRFSKMFFFLKKKFLKDRNKKTSIYFNKVTLVKAKNIDRQVWQDYLHRININ